MRACAPFLNTNDHVSSVDIGLFAVQITALEASVAALTAAVATQTKRAETAEDMVTKYRTRGGEANLAIKDKDVCGLIFRPYLHKWIFENV